MIYRYDLDILRAIAVIAVLLFHFYPETFSYGYLGVDLFFGLSGYLITKISYDKMRDGRFSYLEFYQGRIRRILPLAMMVSLLTVIAGSFVLISKDLLNLVDSSFSTILLIPNIYFLSVGGYFGEANELKPLLHYWSLGVEEQFYIIYPFLLLVLVRFFSSQKVLFCALLSLTAVSFYLNFWMVINNLSNPAFYLTPFRAWQFFVGALAALIWWEVHSTKKKYLLLILVTLISSFFFIPLKPVVSAAFVSFVLAIFCVVRAPAEKPQSMFSNIFIWIGKRSFSLYLWHWPVIVFAKYILVDQLSFSVKVLLIIVVFVVSHLSYLYIEEPFRRKFSFKRVIVFLSTLIILLFSTGVIIKLYDGLPNRHSHIVNSISEDIGSMYRCPVRNYVVYAGNKACLVGKNQKLKPSIALFGNSHALMYGNLFEKLVDSRKVSGMIISPNSCYLNMNINVSTHCFDIMQKNLNSLLNDTSIKTVILAQSWHENEFYNQIGQITQDQDYSSRVDGLLDVRDRLVESGKSVFIIGPIQIPHINIASFYSRQQAFPFSSEKIRTSENRSFFDDKYNKALRIMEISVGKQLIKPHEKLCDSENCYYIRDGKSLFSDSNHLSSSSEYYLRDIFNDIQ